MVINSYSFTRPARTYEGKGITPVSMRVLRKEIEGWIKRDPTHRYTFAVLDNIRAIINKHN